MKEIYFLIISLVIVPSIAMAFKEDQKARDEREIVSARQAIERYNKTIIRLEKWCSDPDNVKDQVKCPGPWDNGQTDSQLTYTRKYLKDSTATIERLSNKTYEKKAEAKHQKVESASPEQLKTYLTQKIGGKSIESYCKYSAMLIQDQSFHSFNHGNYFDCKGMVEKKKEMYEDPKRWEEMFNSSLERSLESWASSFKVIDKVFSEEHKIRDLREYYLKKVGSSYSTDRNLNFETWCKLNAQSSAKDAIQYKSKLQPMDMLIKKCHEQFLPSQRESLGNQRARMLGAIDTFVIYNHFDTEAKIDQLIKGDMSSYKP